MLNGSLRLIRSFAFLASSLALAAWKTFAIIALSSLGFSSKNSCNFLFKLDSTIPLTSEETSLSFVCDENLGSDILTEIIAVMPSRASSPVRSILSFLTPGCLSNALLIVLVRDALKPDRCVPPSFCGILFVKHKISSLYAVLHNIAISTEIFFASLLK